MGGLAVMYTEEQITKVKEYLMSLENDWDWKQEDYDKFVERIVEEGEIETVLMWQENNFSLPTISSAYSLMHQLITAN